MRHASCVVLLVVTLASSANAQRTTPTFRVIIDPALAVRPGYVVQVTYRLQFLSTASDSLSSFAVLSPVPVDRVSAASVPRHDILLGTHKGQQHAASWAWLAASPRSGQRVSRLFYEAKGLPGIVAYRALRDVPVREAGPGEIDDDHPKRVRFDVTDDTQVVGKTIGVVAFPVDRTPAGLVAWLRGQMREACGLGWIDTADCRRLDTKLATEGLAGLRRELDENGARHDAERAQHDAAGGENGNDLGRILLTSALKSLVPQDTNHETRHDSH